MSSMGEVLAMLKGKTTAADKKAEKVTKRNNRKPLLALPAELRNMIYDYIFERGATLAFIEPILGFTFDSSTKLIARKPSSYNTDLAVTCRQLHQETALLPFSTSVVHCESLLVFRELLYHLSKQQLGAIRTLHLMICLEDECVVANFLVSMKQRQFKFSKVLPGVKEVIIEPVKIGFTIRHPQKRREQIERSLKATKISREKLSFWLRDGGMGPELQIHWGFDGLQHSRSVSEADDDDGTSW